MKPRDPDAAAKADAESKQSSRSNPFGAAKPRETVLAAKSGKSEKDILAEEAAKAKLNLRLSREERDQKEAAEQDIEDLKQVLDGESEPERKTQLEAELKEKQTAFDTLMKQFEDMALEKAKTGGGMRPSERRAQQAMQDGTGLTQRGSGGLPYGGADGFENFGGRQNRGGGDYGGGSYGAPAESFGSGGGGGNYGFGGESGSFGGDDRRGGGRGKGRGSSSDAGFGDGGGFQERQDRY